MVGAEVAVARVGEVDEGAVQVVAVLLLERRLVQLHLLHDLLEVAHVVVERILHVVLDDALDALLFERVAHIVERVLVGYRVQHRVDEYHRVEDQLQVVLVRQIVQYFHNILPAHAVFSIVKTK